MSNNSFVYAKYVIFIYIYIKLAIFWVFPIPWQHKQMFLIHNLLKIQYFKMSS